MATTCTGTFPLYHPQVPSSLSIFNAEQCTHTSRPEHYNVDTTGAYLPFDLAYPAQQLAFMLQDTRYPVLLTRTGLLSDFPASLPGTQIICLDQAWEEIGRESTENIISDVTAENRAYIMYTSGSTGKPKGVEVLYRNINRLVFGVDYAQLDETQTILHMAPISFDASTLEVWGALLHGARCVLYRAYVAAASSTGAYLGRFAVCPSHWPV